MEHKMQDDKTLKPPNQKRPRSNELESSIDWSQLPPAARAYIKRLEGKVSGLEGKVSGLEEKNSELKEENSELKEHNRSQSVGRFLREDPPELKLIADGTQKSHTGKSKHRDAQATVFADELELEKEKTSDESGDLDRKTSRVLLEFDQEDGSIGYSTEADISRLVSLALGDAIDLVRARTGRQLHQKSEISLWSDRPDHLVVYDRQSSYPIIAVEDKKPFQTKISGPVLGQVYDYLMQLRCLGHAAPFVVLTTFEHSWLLWQSDTQCQEVLNASNRIENAMKAFQTPTQNGKAKQKTPSPPNLDSPKDISEQTTGLFEKNCKRDNLVISKAFDSKNLVPLLYTAILCGLARSSSVPQQSMTVDPGCFRGMALRLDPKSYEWGELSCSTGKQIQQQGNKDFKKGTYFVIDTLGRGDTSVVFQAYDKYGTLHAIKMYVKRHEGKDKVLPEKLCKREVRRLRELYPTQFNKQNVKYQKLNNFHCVIMPCFEPLSKLERNNSRVRDAVRKCLEKFAERKLHYNESDVRWRHIAYCQNKENKKELIMFDLAELEEGTGEVGIEDQMKNLMERL